MVSNLSSEWRIFVRAGPKGGSNALSTVQYRMDEIHLFDGMPWMVFTFKWAAPSIHSIFFFLTTYVFQSQN
jgi:hypothetical protein